MGRFLCIFLALLQTLEVLGHGRLMDPPARNSMWRFGFPNPVNYNDNELFCGGWAVQWEQNEGKCGLCGDAFNADEPRPHEAGGLYAKGIITRHYSVGQEIDIEVELTANHYGHFIINLCPNNNPAQEATQDCLDHFPLQVSGTEGYHYVLDEDGERKAVFRYKVQLPPYVTCTQCVLQWNYYTGNQWGECDNGTYAQGCGRSEFFRNCADIAIVTSVGAAIPPLFIENYDNPFLLFFRTSQPLTAISSYYPSPTSYLQPLVVRNQVCVPNYLYRSIPGMDHWCQTNCLKYPPNCPSRICYCPTVCEAIGEFSGKKGADVYCMDRCIVYPSNCPTDKCRCHEE